MSELDDEVAANLSQFDGTTSSRVQLLTGLSAEELEELGGLQESPPVTGLSVGWCTPSS